ncbi:MAG TPA: hypothetical protein VHP11_16935 [Tepidisphaeraceae bacterium]|nr:hypothetical protein [Tepidisphaeraceae bacterium]
MIDSLDQLGGQLAALYPEKYIYDVPGFPKVQGKDLAGHLIKQAMQYEPAVYLGQQVLSLDYDAAGREFTIATLQANHRARAILIAAGVGAFRPKKLPLPNAHHYEGRGLAYFASHMEEYRGRRVLMVGGGGIARWIGPTPWPP